eukprot:403354255
MSPTKSIKYRNIGKYESFNSNGETLLPIFASNSEQKSHQTIKDILDTSVQKQQLKDSQTKTQQKSSLGQSKYSLPLNEFQKSGQQLFKITQTRQIIEKDEKLLENRIKMLQNEEHKLLQKIDRTRQQADKLMSIKLQNEEDHRKKIQFQLEQESSIERFKEQKKQQDNYNRQKQMEQTKQFFDDKRQTYLDIKLQRLQNEQNKEELMKQILQQKREKKISVQLQQYQARQKLQQHMKQIVENSQNNYKMRLQSEEERIKSKARNISQMEQQETLLLQKLQNTQQKQHEAYQLLEDAVKQHRSSGKNDIKRASISTKEMLALSEERKNTNKIKLQLSVHKLKPLSNQNQQDITIQDYLQQEDQPRQ